MFSFAFLVTFSAKFSMGINILWKGKWSFWKLGGLNQVESPELEYITQTQHIFFDTIKYTSPNIIMDLLLFAMTKWASLLVDTDCPRGRY